MKRRIRRLLSTFLALAMSTSSIALPVMSSGNILTDTAEFIPNVTQVNSEPSVDNDSLPAVDKPLDSTADDAAEVDDTQEADGTEQEPVETDVPADDSAINEEEPYRAQSMEIETAAINGDGVSGSIVRSPGVFEYGITLGEILDTSGLTAYKNGKPVKVNCTIDWENNTKIQREGSSDTEKADKAKCYDAGTYTVSAYIKVPVSGGAFDVQKNETITILPVVINPDSFAESCKDYVKNGYWAEIYASDKENRNRISSDNILKDCIDKVNNTKGAKKVEYVALYGNHDEVKFDIDWTVDYDSPNYDPKGNKENESYAYTGKLTVSGGANPDNFKINVEPKGYVKVKPVYGLAYTAPESKVIHTSSIEKASSLLDLKLPETGSYTLSSNGTQVKVLTGETESEGAGEQLPIEIGIDAWELEGQPLTLDALKVLAQELSNDNDKEETCVELTPVYNVEKLGCLSDLKHGSPLTLVITSKRVIPWNDNNKVTAPNDVIYGDELGNPWFSVSLQNMIEKQPIVCRYVGVYGTNYDSEEKPSKVGRYRVIALLGKGSDYSGRWASEVFEIKPRPLQISLKEGIGKEYDGKSSVSISPEEVNIENNLPNDDVRIKRAIGYFKNSTFDVPDPANKNKNKAIEAQGTDCYAGEDKQLTISDASLEGNDAANYTFSTLSTSGTISKKKLTLDTSDLRVTKVQARDWKVSGELRLVGVIDDQVTLDLSNASVDDVDNTLGDHKTVTIKGIRINSFVIEGESGGTIYSSWDSRDNYELPSLTKDGDTYSLTFTGAEVLEKPRPVLGTDFKITMPDSHDNPDPNQKKPAKYDGMAYSVEYVELSQGLGAATVQYSKRLANGNFETPSTEKPIDAGIYKVVVSFEESNTFAAAKGDKAITVGAFEIHRGTGDAEVGENVIFAYHENRLVYFDELDLGDGLYGESPYKDMVLKGDFTDGAASGKKGNKYFSVKGAQLNTGSKTFTVKLESSNYSEFSLKVTVKIQTSRAQISVTPKAKPNGKPKGILPLSEALVIVQDKEKNKGTFSFKYPDKLYSPGRYPQQLIQLVFTPDDPKFEPFDYNIHASFTISGEDYSTANEVYFTFYANSEHNDNTDALLNFLKRCKPIHKANNNTYYVNWKLDPATEAYPSFHSQGSRNEWGTLWYSFTGDPYTPKVNSLVMRAMGWEAPPSPVKAYIKVVPVHANSVASLPVDSASIHENQIGSASSDPDFLSMLSLPTSTTVSYDPYENIASPSLVYEKRPNEQHNIVKWTFEDGTIFTRDTLKDKVDKAWQQAPSFKLVPVYGSSFPKWATATPLFTLTVQKNAPTWPAWSGSWPVWSGEEPAIVSNDAALVNAEKPPTIMKAKPGVGHGIIYLDIATILAWTLGGAAVVALLLLFCLKSSVTLELRRRIAKKLMLYAATYEMQPESEKSKLSDFVVAKISAMDLKSV